MAEFICPGHPLLDGVRDLILERHSDILKQGAILIDDSDPGNRIRALVYMEHSIQDARTDREGNRRIVSRRIQFAEASEAGPVFTAGYAPYLDYRPPSEEERRMIRDMSAPVWTKEEMESRAMAHAVEHLVPRHLNEVKARKEELADKTLAAVKDRLTVEINYWDFRAEELKVREAAGKPNARINSAKARLRADELAARLQKRMEEPQQERRVSPLPPNVIAGAMILPIGLIRERQGQCDKPALFARDTRRVELAAMDAVMAAERNLGFEPRDVSAYKCGYDIESRDPAAPGRLRFIEVKGRIKGAETVTVTKNEILTALNKPERFILAIVEVDGESAEPRYVRLPFTREPDFDANSVNYKLAGLIARSEKPN